MKTLLHAEVSTVAHSDSEMGDCPAVTWGRVVRQTPRSIWIKDDYNTEKWTIQANGIWRQPLYGIKRKFEFKIHPLIAFVLDKDAV